MARHYDVIDAHCHYWEKDRPDRPWDKTGFDIAPPLSAEQLIADARDAGLTKIVQVTPTIMGYDNRYGVECAKRYPDRIVGVFARFDPIAPDIARRLAELKAQGKILGVRLTLNKPPWDQWLQTGVLEPFWHEVEQAQIPVAITAADQAACVLDVARRYPKGRFLLDHLGLKHGRFGPRAKNHADTFAHWDDVLALAQASNVFVKISCVPEISHEPFPFKNVHGRLDELYDALGADHLIWGSNYPASKPVCSYKESLDYIDTLSFLNESAKAKILGVSLLRAVGLA